MKFGLMAAGLVVAMGVTAADAAPLSVAPLAPAQTMAPTPAVSTGGEAKLILVRGGCGWGAHRTYSGRCHLNYGWRGRVRARHRWWRHHYWR